MLRCVSLSPKVESGCPSFPQKKKKFNIKLTSEAFCRHTSFLLHQKLRHLIQY